MESQNNVFEKLHMDLTHLSPKLCDSRKLLETINQLNALNYRPKIPFLTKWVCTDMVMMLLDKIKEFHLQALEVDPVLQLIVNVAAKQEIIICSMSVNVILHGLKDLWSLYKSNTTLLGQSNLLCSLWGAISAVVYGNGAYIIPDSVKWLLDEEEYIANLAGLENSQIMEGKKMYVQCLAGLCLSSESREQLNDDCMLQCLRIFIKVLQSVGKTADVSFFKLAYSAHKGLHNILEHSSGLHTSEIGPLLAALKRHLVFGLPFASAAGDLPTVLHPLPIPEVMKVQSNAPRRTGRKKKKKNRAKSTDRGGSTNRGSSHGSRQEDASQETHTTENTHLNNNASANESVFTSVMIDASGQLFFVTSSESEFSDTEAGQRSKMHSFALKIRQIAFGNLYLVIRKTSRHIMFGFWNSFLHGANSSSDISLLFCVTNDPAPKARVAALMVLGAMVEGSKQFLSLVCKESTSTSFVPFSGLITSAIHACHDTLLSALLKERSLITQVHILKALSTLAANTPYSKLQHGLVSKMISNVQLFMQRNPDTDSQIAALNVFVALFSHEPALSEVACGISDKSYSTPADASPFAKLLSQPLTATLNGFTHSWFVEQCLGLLDFGKENIPMSLRVASLQALTACCKPYFVLAKQYVARFKDAICSCLSFDNVTVKLHACKLLEILGGCLLHHTPTDVTASARDNAAMWEFLLTGPLPSISQSSEDPIIRSHLCDCLSTIGPTVFEMLPRKLQVFCQTLLLGFTCDENYLVRSAAVRSLAVYIMYPFLRKDVAFVEDVASCILKLMHDSIKSVQCNAAWSFGNLTDAIIVSVEADETFRGKIGNKLLLDLFENAVATIDNKDKVRFNVMRALGNLLRFCNAEHMTVVRLKLVMLQAVNIIASGVTKDSLMKVRWNACLACGNFLNNSCLPIGDPEWTDDIYVALCEAVSKSKNYKVRIKAAAALSCVQSAESFGMKFGDVLSCITLSMENLVTETTEDFEEFRFRDRLNEQLCCTFLHLVKLMKFESFENFVELFTGPETYQTLAQLLRNCLDVVRKRVSLTADVTKESVQETYIALGQLLDKDKIELFDSSCANWNMQLIKFKDDSEEKTIDCAHLEIFDFYLKDE